MVVTRRNRASIIRHARAVQSELLAVCMINRLERDPLEVEHSRADTARAAILRRATLQSGLLYLLEAGQSYPPYL